MAMMKQCRCGKLIDMSLSYCESCQDKQKDRHKSYDKYKRDKQATSFYRSREWKKLSMQVYVKQHGLCQMCLKKNRMTTGSTDKNGKFKRNIIDHIIPISVDWNKRLDITNLWVLCQSCHNKKTAEDRQKYKG